MYLLGLDLFQTFQEHQHANNIILLYSLEILDCNFVDEIVNDGEVDCKGLKGI
jgi:hypothetical protein